MRKFRILIMGLPGSGKTTLGRALSKKLNYAFFNADEVREQFNDWDFSIRGRRRQAERMKELSFVASYHKRGSVVDFVCPTKETRGLFNGDFTIFMNTIPEGRFEDTNKLFEPPEDADLVITEWKNVDEQVEDIIKILNNIPNENFDYQAPTGMMIGRFQPFHDGHKKLFEKILEKEGQVVICIRDTHDIDDKNPLSNTEVMDNIYEALEPEYGNKFRVHIMPNITGVYYGRDVGYKVEKIDLDAETEAISATQIRKEMGL